MRKTDLELVQEPVLAEGGAVASKLELAHAAEDTQVTGGVIHQQTISRTIEIEGIGLHKGTVVHLVLKPADADCGIIFRRTDLGTDDRAVTDIAARYDTVCETTMCTTIGNAAGTKVATIEHLMAALGALGIDNVLVELDAEEVPMMDGSSDAFVAALDKAGVRELPAPRRFIRLLRAVELVDGQKHGVLAPHEDGFRVEFDIDFDNAVIGKQHVGLNITPDVFRSEISSARTFGFLKDVELLRSLGLAQGATLDNAIVLDGDEVLNDEGLRSPDEFVRHKVLDAIGDLALAGAPILGLYSGVRAGHAFNNEMLHALFANPDAWEYVTLRHDAPVEPVALAVSAD